jgi:trigger factor
LKVLRRQRATYEIEARPAADGDRVIVDFTGRIDGVEFPGGQRRSIAILLGEWTHAARSLEIAITGMQAGETNRSISRSRPNYHGKEVAGKQADFTLTVKIGARSILPGCGCRVRQCVRDRWSGSIDELKAEITANLKLELKRKIEAKVKGAGARGPPPAVRIRRAKSLVEQEAQNMDAANDRRAEEKGNGSENREAHARDVSAAESDRACGACVLRFPRSFGVHELQPGPSR